MSEILVYAAISVISSVSSAIMTYVIAKHLIGTDSLMQKFEEIVSEIRDSPELQQKIASLGMIIGVGIKQGVGLGKGTGKRNIEGAIVEGLMNMFMPKLAQAGRTEGNTGGESVFG